MNIESLAGPADSVVDDGSIFVDIDGVMQQVLLTEQQAQSLLDTANYLIQRGEGARARLMLGHLLAARGISGALRGRARQLYRVLQVDTDESEGETNFSVDYTGSAAERYSNVSEEGEDRFSEASQSLTLSADYAVSDTLDLYGELELNVLFEGDGIFDLDTQVDVQYGDFSVSYNPSDTQTPTSITFGRQSLTDNRGWWWDTSLDSLQYYKSTQHWLFTLGAATPLLPADIGGSINPEADDVYYAFGHLSRGFYDRQFLDLFFLLQRDGSSQMPVGENIPQAHYDAQDADLNWVGLRLHGRLGEDRHAQGIQYWLDYSHVNGQEIEADSEFLEQDSSYDIDGLTRRRVNGWAVDMGFSMQTQLPFHPRVSLSIAQTSRDHDLGDDTDTAFRQTGWHSNVAQVGDFDETAIYGNVLSPQLSNLQVLTASIDFPLFNSRYLQFSWHRYRQLVAADFLTDASVELSPLGINRAIGQGIDINLPIAAGSQWESSLGYSVFQAGGAFGAQQGERDHLLELDIEYAF